MVASSWGGWHFDQADNPLHLIQITVLSNHTFSSLAKAKTAPKAAKRVAKKAVKPVKKAVKKPAPKKTKAVKKAAPKRATKKSSKSKKWFDHPFEYNTPSLNS